MSGSLSSVGVYWGFFSIGFRMLTKYCWWKIVARAIGLTLAVSLAACSNGAIRENEIREAWIETYTTLASAMKKAAYAPA